MKLPPRLPLRIPGGWHVRHNELRAIDPETLATDHPDWVLMTQDLMQLEQPALKLLLDVGWYPDERPDGRFSVSVILDGEWERPLATFSARSVTNLVEHVEQLLALPPEAPYERLVERLTHPDPETRADSAEQLARRELVEAVDSVRDALGREKDEETIDRLHAAMHSLIRQRNQARSEPD